MNAVELYRKLSGSNCGECGLPTCMAFAMSVIKGETDLAQCPHLSEEEVASIRGSLSLSDWREELISKLREEVKGISFSDVAKGIGAELKGDALNLKCLGRDFVVYPDGEIETRGHITPWVKILILHYIKTGGNAELTGKRIAYREIRGGMVKDSAFSRDCEEPLRALLDSRFEKVLGALKMLGAQEAPDLPTRFSWQVYLLPKIPVSVLYWPADEEFDSKVSVLFDSTADKFLDCEALIFLLEGFVKNIEMMSMR